MNKILEDFTEEKRGTMCYNCRNVFCETCVRGLALEALEDYKQEIREKIEGMKRDEDLEKAVEFEEIMVECDNNAYNKALQAVLDKLN